jgi:DNA repair protein RecO (recombination protein O)
MIEKTGGIVLHSIRHGDTSLIVKVFTRTHGVQAYIIPGVRKVKSRVPNNLFQPLTIIDLVAYHKEKGGLQHIKEVSCPKIFNSIPYDILKSSVAIFLSEILNKSLKELDPNPGMYDFITQALRYFDQTENPSTNFHLVFLMHLSRYLGFQPRNNYDVEHCFFNLREGVFQKYPGDKHTCLDKELSLYFHQINTCDLYQHQNITIKSNVRRSLLTSTIDYYSFHLEGFKGVKSHLILETVLG